MELNESYNPGMVNNRLPSTEILDNNHDDYLPAVESVLVESHLGNIAATNIPTTVVAATLDLSKTFSLNSLAGASKTIYLDFDGNTTTGTYWNDSNTPIITPAYDFDGNNTSFSSAELERIQYIWQRVAEDFSPFNVNVTTQSPTDLNDLIKSSATDTRWGVRVAIGGSSSDWFGASAGGVAYLNSFNWNTDTPAFVFKEQLSNGNEKYTAEAISHEVGHTLGLDHDGQTTPVTEYYTGQGTGETGWAPIMGASYYQNLSQWSKGEYTGANNTEDDLQIITSGNGFSYRTDDVGNTISTATALILSGNTISGNGIIERNTDVDFYSFTAETGAITLNVNPAARGANLDILAELYSADGTLIVTSNSIDSLAATISTTIQTAGTYYLKIDGVGKGDPLTTGYSDYGSLGQYSISGNIVPKSQSLVSLALATTSVLEDGTDNLVYTFSRTGDITNALTVNYKVGGNATFGTDYSQYGANSFAATTGKITFEAGANTAILNIDPTADKTLENNETVALTLSTGDNYTVGNTNAVTGTIIDDELPVVSLKVSHMSVLEDGNTNIEYTFTRTGSTAKSLTVKYGVNGTAIYNQDYTQTGATSFNTTSGQITFAANSDTAKLIIDPKADTAIELDETIGLTLKKSTGYNIGPITTIQSTILNDDLAQIASNKSRLSSQSIDLTDANSNVIADDNSKIGEGLSLDLSQIVAPMAKLSFSIDRSASYNNSVGFYQALDASGAIETSQGILKPTDAGYIQAALQNALGSGLNLSAENGKQTNITADLEQSFYLPILVANGTLIDAANGQNLYAYTAFAGANADRTEHIRSIGNSTFGFEDMFGGGDRDYNDIIIKASIG